MLSRQDWNGRGEVSRAAPQMAPREIYLDSTSLKGVCSMKLHRGLGVIQKTVWQMRRHIRKALAAQGPQVHLDGPVEVDETDVDGKQRRKHGRNR